MVRTFGLEKQKRKQVSQWSLLSHPTNSLGHLKQIYSRLYIVRVAGVYSFSNFGLVSRKVQRKFQWKYSAVIVTLWNSYRASLVSWAGELNNESPSSRVLNRYGDRSVCLKASPAMDSRNSFKETCKAVTLNFSEVHIAFLTFGALGYFHWLFTCRHSRPAIDFLGSSAWYFQVNSSQLQRFCNRLTIGLAFQLCQSELARRSTSSQLNLN